MNKFFREKKKLIVIIVIVLMIVPLLITGISALGSSKENIAEKPKGEVSEDINEESLLENGTNNPKKLKYLNQKESINTNLLKTDMEKEFGYEFVEAEITESSIKEFSDKNSDLKIFATINENESIPRLLTNEAVIKYEELDDFDIMAMSGLDFLTERQLGFTKEDIVERIDKIKQLEKVSPAGKDEEMNFHNFSYKMIEDIFITFMIMSDGEIFSINYEIADTNMTAIDYSDNITNIANTSLANNFTPFISIEKALYQKRILKDYISYEQDYLTGKDYFSFVSLEKMSLENLEVQSKFLLDFLFETLGIENEAEVKYVSDLFMDSLQTVYEKKDADGMTSLPIELFLWKFDINIIVTNNTIKIDFIDIQYLDELPEYTEQKLTEDDKEVSKD